MVYAKPRLHSHYHARVAKSSKGFRTAVVQTPYIHVSSAPPIAAGDDLQRLVFARLSQSVSVHGRVHDFVFAFANTSSIEALNHLAK